MSRRLAFITGGGGAIAGEIALRLQARGYDLILADLGAERMAANAQRLERPPARLLEADLSATAGIERLARTIAEDHPDLDLLVNNAGYVEPGDVAELDPEVLDRHVMINLLAPMRLAQAAATGMRRRGRGDILSIVSMGGIIALRGSAAYAATKFGLRGFQTSIQAELHPSGVRVMGVFPSGVDTPMLHKEAVHPGGSPLNFVGRVLTPAEVANACMKALDTGKLETYAPYDDSVLARFFGAFPGLLRRVEPFVARIGERGRERFIRERGLRPHA
ncbi:SDR family NAD(P)-dependent oxidoreductase [Phenylobacterium sp.]|uniref:SDR family NAD(P)-dependent oxidoreductase n=1 Tax=Phenylobacterium sp. TaxID=1871053 RepID=UPI0035B0D953